MGSKRKFKRDYIILEAKDMNFRYKDRVLPKAFAKVEINDEKSVIALYVENLKYMSSGYKVMAIRSDYETIDLGKITVSEQGKGEFVLDLNNDEGEIKGIALLYEKTVPLIGFKGSKIENYEEILFTGEEEYIEEYIEEIDNDDFDKYEEIEYIEVEDDDDDFDEYEEIEYIEVDEYEEEETDDIEDDEEYEEDEDSNNCEEDEDIHDGDSEDDQGNENDNNRYKRESDLIETEYEIPEYNRTSKIKNVENQKISNDKPKSTHKKIHQQKTKQHKEASKYVNESTRKQENNNPYSTLLMPRQIKKGLKYFKEVKPFVSDYIEGTRWWKIEINPTTLCGYTMPYLGYVNTLNYTMYSDAVMQSYKYRHYLFGVQYDEYNKRKNYIYAVPGEKEEQPDKGHTGFRKYQPCDNRNNSLGYWLCFIDSRSRRIVK